MIDTLCNIGPSVYAVKHLPTKQEICELCQDKGRVYLTDYSCIYQENNRKRTVFILAEEARKLYAARKAVCELTGLTWKDCGYTYAQMARQVSEWINLRQRPNGNVNGLIKHWHFQHCTPALLDHASVFDMRSAYWQIACRAKSLLCDIYAQDYKVTWRVVPNDLEERWERCKVSLEPFKRLRLAIIGVNSTGLSGDSSGTGYFYRGNSESLPGIAPTCFQPLAQLTVRVAYELTQFASIEGNSLYSNADCVTLVTGRPTIWDDYGIEYRERAAGPLDVIGIGIWKCGTEQTLPYDTYAAKNYCSPPTYAPLLPDPYFCDLLLN